MTGTSSESGGSNSNNLKYGRGPPVIKNSLVPLLIVFTLFSCGGSKDSSSTATTPAGVTLEQKIDEITATVEGNNCVVEKDGNLDPVAETFYVSKDANDNYKASKTFDAGAVVVVGGHVTAYCGGDGNLADTSDEDIIVYHNDGSNADLDAFNLNPADDATWFVDFSGLSLDEIGNLASNTSIVPGKTRIDVDNSSATDGDAARDESNKTYDPTIAWRGWSDPTKVEFFLNGSATPYFTDNAPDVSSTAPYDISGLNTGDQFTIDAVLTNGQNATTTYRFAKTVTNIPCAIGVTGAQASYDEGENMNVLFTRTGGDWPLAMNDPVPNGATVTIGTDTVGIGGTIAGDGSVGSPYTNTVEAGTIASGVVCENTTDYTVNDLALI